MWKEYRRLCRGNIILFGQGIFTARMIPAAEDIYRYSLIYEKSQPTMENENQRRAYYKLITVGENRNQYKPFEMEPIPLTPEYLERFGFENKQFDDIWTLKLPHPLEEDSSTSGFEYSGKILYICRNGRWSWKQRVEYVHQLQNLYFALTGKELELK